MFSIPKNILRFVLNIILLIIIKVVGVMVKFKHPRSQELQNSTLRSFSFIILIGQYFALFPIDRIRKPNIIYFKFRWISYKTAYTFVYLMALTVNMGFQIFNMAHVTDLSLNHFVTFLFYGSSFATTILFLKLAYHFNKLAQKWDEIDCRMRAYEPNTKLSFRLKITSFIIFLTAFLEHALYLTSALTNIRNMGNTKGLGLITYFLYSNFTYIFDYISFALWKGIIFFIINLLCTVTWNYMDLFVIIISITMASKFQQITFKIKMALKNKDTSLLEYFATWDISLLDFATTAGLLILSDMLLIITLKDPAFWQSIRSDYNALTVLCSFIDNAISDIILLSFANNLFVVLIQLYNSLSPKSKNVAERFYFMYSFSFLLVRTTAVSIYAASVNEASKEPTRLLLSALPEVYNVEIERLLYKIQVDPCSLTGRKLFRVTKALLNIAGAVITYELVLIQFQVYYFTKISSTVNITHSTKP